MLPSSKNKASKGCWTCKGYRKVRCDLGLPSCANCARVQQRSSNYFNTVSCDESSYLVVDPKRDNLLEEQNAVQSTAFLSLATCSTSAVIIRDALVRIAVANHTIPSRAVLHALLALSSLHRDGEQLQATQHKTAAVGALGASAKNGIRTTAEAAQHVAANMLLCSFETYRGSDFHGHWPWYLMGAKEISKAASLESHISQTDIRELVLWTFYHDILARFSLFHWRQESVLTFLTKGLGIGAEWQRNICAFAAELELDLGPLPRILRYLGDTVRALCKSVNSPVSSRDFKEEVHAAERGVLSVPELPTPPTSSTNEEARSFAALTELYRTAVLVYIARICENKFSPPSNTASHQRLGNGARSSQGPDSPTESPMENAPVHRSEWEPWGLGASID
ncbi:hypothetical protein NUW58_g7864 [Xylaria curta]|uniref:Uncharacterized protein n=1 Tax=Xylaria curta TaxID=42375 RepID=A0ACC1ND74_9PEZI|nr:hypothetical protein NUW58_g7864 [Xylaria curta]